MLNMNSFYSRCSLLMMVGLANHGVLLTNATKMLVNDGEMSAGLFTHFTIIDEHFAIIDEQFTTINEHFTIINEHISSISLKYTIICSFVSVLILYICTLSYVWIALSSIANRTCVLQRQKKCI